MKLTTRIGLAGLTLVAILLLPLMSHAECTAQASGVASQVSSQRTLDIANSLLGQNGPKALSNGKVAR